MATHPDLQAEQAYLDRAYDRLEAMRRAAENLRDSVIDAGRGGTHQARVERDVFVQTGLQRLEQLKLGRASLCFGRIDREVEPGLVLDSNGSEGGRSEGGGSEGGGSEGGGSEGEVSEGEVERFYIGRIAVSGEQQEPLVVDWRAPVAEAFYRATGRAPMSLRRRRHFATDGPVLLAIEDELFRADGEGGDGELELVGPGALLAALQRSRSGQMRDIVATVQREQDEVIRAELPGVLVVQGGPGTGKTAVALHRAAYLLYTHRFPLEQQGVLVVGPNQLFLRYIEQVLPSLGESGVALTTVAGLLPAIRPRHADSPLAAQVKGDARMAEVLAHAIRDRERGLRDELVVGFGSLSLRVAARTTRGIAAAVKRRPGPHNQRRRQVETLLFRSLHDDYTAAASRSRRSGLGVGLPGTDGTDLTVAELTAQVRRDPAVVAALDRMWPVLTPEELLNDLFGSPALLAMATRELLQPGERDALARERARSFSDVPWTPSDLPLIDEAKALLGSRRSRRRSANGSAAPDDEEELRAYGHIVVDEAQDLSPMALRMLSRRSISGSMTLVGDMGQATSGAAPANWNEVLVHLPARRPPRLVTLTVNYRTPAEIMEVAAEVLSAADVTGIGTPRSVRATGRLPTVHDLGEGGPVAEEVAVIAAVELEAVGGGTVAVIGPTSLVPALAEALTAAGVAWGDPDHRGLVSPVTLLDVTAAKGLEFDSVVVAEPAGIVAESAEGLRLLYVALTRPTRRLVAVHSRPLPAPLVRGLARARQVVGEGPSPLLEDLRD